MTLTDDELVARSGGGDAESLNQLILRWERPIYALAVRVIGHGEDALVSRTDGAAKAPGEKRKDVAAAGETIMSEMFTCGDHAALVSYLYDECEPPQRRAISAHIAICSACAEEAAGLTATREQLALWS